MSKVLKVIGTVAAGIALIATGVGAFAGAAIAATASRVATIAGLVAGVANVGAALLYKPPPARGSVTQVLIAVDPPTPYVMGEGLVGGVLRYDAAYGATLNKVQNPYRWQVHVYSGGGPVQSISPRVDQLAVSSWYSTYLYTDTQTGACPESTALAPNFSGPPGWDSASKLSGLAAIGWNAKFDKDGKRFASGLPVFSAYCEGVKVYDPRLDSTRAGGSGAHRVDDETTWAFSENPALHAGTYAFGRYQNGTLVLGVGLPDEAVDWAAVAAWANVCDSNGWTIFGRVFEPGDRWANLKEICEAGGGAPVPLSWGGLTFHYAAPRVSVGTLTDADLAGEEASVTAMASWRDRLNTVIPRITSPDHNWEQVALDPVQVSAHVTLDGEVKAAEWPFNLVKDADQGAQLARYKIEDSRELQPIEITYGPSALAFRPGDQVDLEHPELGLDTPAVILRRRFDPATMTVALTFIGETTAKHAFALGETGTAPPVPAIGQTGEERDELLRAAGLPVGYESTQIRSAASKNPRDTSDVPRAMLIGVDAGSNASIQVARHDWDYPGETADVTREAATITGLTYSQFYYVYFDDDTLADTTPTYAVTTDPAESLNSTAHPYRHPLGLALTPAAGNPPEEGGSNAGYGYVYQDYY